MPCCGEGGHEEGWFEPVSSALAGAPAGAVLPGVLGVRGEPCEAGGLSSVELAELWHEGDQGADGDGAEALVPAQPLCGVGEGGAFRAPMAIAVMGGIIVSTVLSLVVVPAFFLIMDDISRLLGWIFGRMVGRKEEEQEVLDNDELTRILNENSRTISALEERLQTLEMEKGAEAKPLPAGRSRQSAANDLREKPLAAE